MKMLNSLLTNQELACLAKVKWKNSYDVTKFINIEVSTKLKTLFVRDGAV